MAQIFHPATNILARVSILGSVALVVLTLVLLGAAYRSDWSTRLREAVEQPVPFSHRHHVADAGLDCRYCHWPVEEGPFAGIPPYQVCMTCHGLVWEESDVLEPVRRSQLTGAGPSWVRVHDLPDYAYFDHSIHIRKGVGCVTCHGRVDRMPLTWKEEALHMRWCVDCHRNPEPHLRPRDAVFTMDWTPPAGTPSGPELAREHAVRRTGLDDCSVCHR